MDLQQQFEEAVAASKELKEKPANEILLQLYGLYKQATIGDVNIDAPTNPFDVVNKAKYSAWQGLQGTEKENAMQQYITLVNDLK